MAVRMRSSVPVPSEVRLVRARSKARAENVYHKLKTRLFRPHASSLLALYYDFTFTFFRGWGWGFKRHLFTFSFGGSGVCVCDFASQRFNVLLLLLLLLFFLT